MDRGVEVFVGLLATLGTVVIGAGVAIGTTTDRNPDGFYVAGGFILLAAFLIAFLRFVFHPMMVKAARWRERILTEARRRGGGNSHLAIRSAEYGGANVTDIVRGSVRDDRLNLLVSNESMGVDPIPGVVKTLKLVYVLDGRKKTARFTEGDVIRLPEP